MGSSSIIPTIVYMQQQLTRYACSVWLIFGIPGCLLNVILLSRRQMRGTSCCNSLRYPNNYSKLRKFYLTMCIHD
ncbi:unnamed protein product [Rotaria magnacalcarata]|uniref:Uncharacterized protein n=1 Tax=Rotaria magnacalcarata TaxID=392030 RepID=A0A8S2X4M5_9BILA|nr:unnamed protein product [Rotaria magnacalcarata]